MWNAILRNGEKINSPYAVERLCRPMCGKAVPFRFCLIKIVGGYAAQSLHTLHGEVKPHRASGGRAAKLRLPRKVKKLIRFKPRRTKINFLTKIQKFTQK